MAKILVVDDDDTMRQFLVLALKAFGHEPIQASDLPSAIALFDANKATLNLAWLDLNFNADAGDKTGVTLARHIRAADPNMLIVLHSGRTGSLSADERLLFDAIIDKPARIAEIKSAVEDVLARRPGSAPASVHGAIPPGAD